MDIGMTTDTAALQYRVGFLGIPWLPDRPPEVSDYWTTGNIERLKAMGFNTLQLSVAWGSRPADEPLNIEDVVELPEALQEQYPQTVPLRCNPSPERRRQRREDLQRRIALCRGAGMRSIFHFGAPYNAHARYGDGPPNCIMDDKVVTRYELLLDEFAREFPGVDDILVYTYDQDAWLCSEFGPCPRCLGVPLHERVMPFLRRLADRWAGHSPEGRLWWEPWELSAGQVLQCVQMAEPRHFGLALHANVAEVMATYASDRWLKNTCALAAERGIPVLAEYFLGAQSEELEPLFSLAHPLVTLRGLRAIADTGGVCGIKEYYGLMPSDDDANLLATELFFANPAIGDREALAALAKPYGEAGAAMMEFWRESGMAMELFPWETSWYIRKIGRSRPAHSLSAAMLRGQQAHTPSWCSTRHAIFMKTDDAQPDPWMLEDVELRCRLASARWLSAIEAGRSALPLAPEARRPGIERAIADTARIARRARAYACHLRETNLAAVMRALRDKGEPVPERLIKDLRSVMKEDLENCRGEQADWPQMDEALDLLEKDLDRFLKEFLREEPGKASKGAFSVTSR